MPRSWKPEGFTLVELLVSISIIGIITGAMMANFRGGQRYAEVRLASDLLVAQIRSMQTSSFAGRLVSVCSGGSNDLAVCEPKNPPTACGGGGICQKRVPAGYGLHFAASTADSYTLFYDTDGDRLYDTGEELISVPYVSTNSVRFQGTNAGATLDLVYAPPYGQAYVNGSSSGTPIVTVTLDHQYGSYARHVNVYALSGKIEHD